MQLPMQAEKLLPHRGQMLLIDSILTADQESGTALADLSTESLALGPDGKVLEPFYIELVAQTYAAVCGYHLQTLGQPVPEGYLVGVQKFQIIPQPRYVRWQSSELLISVHTVGDFDGFAVVEGSVSREGNVLAEGKIKLFVPQDESMAELAAQLKSGETVSSWQL
ncbi:3-hydroxylacyl-ACP dehydratase [Desulfovibrio sp. JC010]|uniref:3-hydroxylacyl-ACP dehydratase n=1 Tax=Desulfovibrio sp. JC010 TaxID=2593641 RepID=UPI0013D6DD09|nr:3-hydroxylacyl-ACP dehydratase [Desulfovibrio sp. JC010]NDV26730.1 3-hydroxylacyl-ACP dehydratase [Desulfovibrio sp. JC010]